jgi:hypothetical protein
MHRLKYFLLVLFNFILVGFCYSQMQNRHFEINWQKKQTFFSLEAEQRSKYLLCFEGAVYEQNKNHLPIFAELLKTNGENVKIRILNEKYAVLTAAETADVVDIDKIPDKIEVISKVRYSKRLPFIEFSFIPLRKNRLTGQFEKLLSFDIEYIKTNNTAGSYKRKKILTNQSVLSSGKWVKIKIPKSGVYKLTFDELRNLGIEQPENIRIFGNGGKMLPYYNSEDRPDDLIENHVLIRNNEVYFYGDGPVQWNYDETNNFFRQQRNLYSDYAYYFLTSDYNSGDSNAINQESQATGTQTHTVNTYTNLIYHEIDTLNLIGSGRLWVGESFDFQNKYSFSFEAPNLVGGSSVKLETSLVARSPISSTFLISLNNAQFTSVISPVTYKYEQDYARQKVEKFEGSASNSEQIDLQIEYTGSASSEGWLDYICLNTQCGLRFENNQLHFRNTQSVGIGNISQFQLSNANNNVIVWDVTNPQKPKQVNASLNGTNLNFKLATDTLREFVAFEASMAYSPITSGDDLGLVENQNLHSVSQTDYVIISHPEFMEYARELKQIHESENKLSIQLIDIEQVYNEFSSGAKDVSAIRDFMKMLYDRATTAEQLPKYLCLFGDGSYDNKHNFSKNTNFILTYQSENSLSPTASFVTDDFFGLLDDNEGGHDGLVDIGIGRFPIKNTNEAANMIQKIRDYLSIEAYSDWRNRLCFIADDEDGNLHQDQADELTEIVKNRYPVFNIEKIFLDAYVQETSSAGQRYPDAKLAINNQIEKGVLLINYTGHGGESGLAEERIITIDQINKWSNSNKLPVFMTATCEFSRFDNYEKTTAGELVFLNPKGGAIALFTTTRLVYASPNFVLNKNFYNYLFENDITSNEKLRLGDVMRFTKNATSGFNKRNFTLLGDPALEFSYAKYYVKTNSINNQAVQQQADTLKALDRVTITGEVQNINGVKINDYNGIVFPTVYDKEREIKTLNNDGEGVFTFKVRNSQLFKGKASVKNGDFQFSFIVPKDIKYNVDTGKISYYSANNQLLEDGKGSFKNILIGGSGSNNILDNEGPKIQIYLNDESFVNGGITNSTPKLLAFLNDESGINTTGSGIGHDIVATIDDKTEQQFTLNEYYESDIDDYTSGQLKFSFPELEPGEHKLHLKAWDVYNNSAEDSIIFNVVESERFEISHVLNYPNPFSTNTSFFFEHNRPNEPLEVLLHVFTVAGKIVKTVHTEMLTEGFRSEGIPWNGRDDFGNKIGRGVYFYKLSVRTSSGEKTEKIEKLLILN